MEQTVAFPGLGLEFNINRVAFQIGNIPVYWYGILIALGFILAIIYVNKRAKEFGIDPDRMLDVIMGGAVGGIVGARAYYVLLKWDYYGQNPIEILYINNGGLAIYGGIIGALLGGLTVAKIQKMEIMPDRSFNVQDSKGSLCSGSGSGCWRILYRTGNRTLGQLCEY